MTRWIQKYFFAAFVVVSITLFGWLVWYTWHTMRVTAYDSCLASLMKVIQRQASAQVIAARSDDWHILSTEEFDAVMTNVRGTDCGGFNDPKLDFYGNRINIALRRGNKDQWPNVIVWSNGWDGVSGTNDDSVMPYGQSIPK